MLAFDNRQWLSNAIKPNQTKSYIFNIYMYKEMLAFDNRQWLIFHKTQTNPTYLSGNVLFYRGNKLQQIEICIPDLQMCVCHYQTFITEGINSPSFVL